MHHVSSLSFSHLQLHSLSGHGKLTSGDNGYYEGGFVNGEIEGHGYKVFGISGTVYTGHFHLGEMHGQGLIRKLNGEQYEGDWSLNKKQGIMQGKSGVSPVDARHRMIWRTRQEITQKKSLVSRPFPSLRRRNTERVGYAKLKKGRF